MKTIKYTASGSAGDLIILLDKLGFKSVHTIMVIETLEATLKCVTYNASKLKLWGKI